MEGGMAAALWAGSRRKGAPARIRLGVELDAEEAGTFIYEIEAGLPPPGANGGSASAAFPDEPQIKTETILHCVGPRKFTLMERSGPHAVALEDAGGRRDFGERLLASETALSALQDAARLPDLHMLRRHLADWRFYHDLRTDAASPLRAPCLAVAAPTLASDGQNLAAVFATLVHIREDKTELDAAVETAFPGAELVVPLPGESASFGMIFPDHPKRVFSARELSDGTLRYLGLAGALLSYRLPSFLALNEPESSLHPDLMEPLAGLIVRAAERTQIWLVTHSERLANAIEEISGIAPRRVVKKDGETWIEGLKLGGEFRDEEE